MKKKHDEPWVGQDSFLYDISLNEKSTVLLIRVFGSIFQMQSSLIDLFSYNTNFDKYNILTIGSPSGFTDKNLIAKAVSQLLENDNIPKYFSQICVFLSAHGVTDSESGEFGIVARSDWLNESNNLTITADEFFTQILPVANITTNPINFISICCYGENLHSSKIFSEFPLGTSSLVFSESGRNHNIYSLFKLVLMLW